MLHVHHFPRYGHTPCIGARMHTQPNAHPDGCRLAPAYSTQYAKTVRFAISSSTQGRRYLCLILYRRRHCAMVVVIKECVHIHDPVSKFIHRQGNGVSRGLRCSACRQMAVQSHRQSSEDCWGYLYMAVMHTKLGEKERLRQRAKLCEAVVARWATCLGSRQRWEVITPWD